MKKKKFIQIKQDKLEDCDEEDDTESKIIIGFVAGKPFICETQYKTMQCNTLQYNTIQYV